LLAGLSKVACLANTSCAINLSCSSSLMSGTLLPTLKDRLGDQRGGSEWEPIKILLEGD
jgi:hypothetical protein